MDQAAGVEQVDAPAPVGRWLQDIFQAQGRLAKKRFGALLFQAGQPAQQSLA
ncbi:hypothetical protein D3C81_1451930 [compost metagenome]